MANLETLELTINANAERATQGIGTLVRSLSALSTAVGKNIGGLMKLNEQLAQLKQYGKMKLSISTEITNSGKEAAKAAKAAKGNPLSQEEAEEYAKAMSKMDILRKKQSGTLTDLGKALGATKQNEYRVGSLTERYQKLTDAINGVSKSSKKAKQFMGEYDPATNNNRVAVNRGDPNAVPDDVWEEQYKKRHEAYLEERKIQQENNKRFRLEQENKAKLAAEAAKARQAEAMSMVNMSKPDLLMKKAQAMTAEYVRKAASGQLSAKQMAEGAMQIRNITTQIEKLNADSGKTPTFFERIKSAFHKVGEAANKVGSRFGRLASTMIMRTAIKALIKSLSEAWNAAYTFSKKMGGSFAKSIDNIKGSFQSMSINIVRAFAPLIQVVAPIISVIASGIKYLTDAIIALLKVIGIASDLFGATAENIAAVGGASGSATKDVLASFDELNVLDSSSGGGGSGGSGGGNFLKDFTEQIETVKVIVGEALLAVGLILAFMGHPAVGIGLAAVGAAAIAGTIATKWGSLSDEVKGEIAKIMIIAGGAMLAIGAIIAFACPTKLGLGIALMAAGAVSLVAGVALSWGLSDQVKEEVGKITAIVGGALLAIGAILAFACPGTQGIGIAMMAAGGVSLVASVALNWNSLKEKIVSVFESIKKKLVKIWQKVEGAVTGAWESVKNWASATWSKIGAGWANIKAKLADVWNKVKLAVVNAWAKVSNWINLTWDKIKEGWENIKNGLKGVWDTVSKAVSDAWTAVGDWISARWEDISKGWESIKQGFSDIWTGIQSGFEAAWNVIKQLWEDPLGMLSKAWGGVVTWFRYNIVKPLQEALPGIFGEWKEEPEGESDPINALVKSWNGKTGLEEAINQLLAVTAKKVVDTEVLRVLKERMPKVKASDIVKITKWDEMAEDARRDMLTAIVAIFGSEGIKSIKSQFPDIKASDLISVKEWDKFSLEQKFEFLKAISNAFGDEGVKQVLLATGFDAAKIWKEGAKQGGEKGNEMFNLGKHWASLIENGANSNPPKISVKLNDGSVKTVIDDIKKRIEDGVNPKIKVNKINVPDDQKKDAKDSIEKGVKPNVTVNISAGDFSEFRKAFIKALSAKLNFTDKGVDYFLGQLTARASGGFVNSGDIFIANENNVPEMIGRFGNQTAVANTDQIVAGIASGVSAANQEQNALLRQQNALLTEILQKDNTVRLTASSALGRTVNQSLKMYGQMVGV